MSSQITLSFSLQGEKCFVADLSQPIDIGISLRFEGSQPQAFFLPRAEATAFSAGSFVGDTRQGGSVNCFSLRLTPHGNGTHTECVGHIVEERVSVDTILRESFSLAYLLRVPLESLAASGETYAAPHDPQDRVISARALQHAWDVLGGGVAESAAWVLQTNAYSEETEAVCRVYSGQNPAYLTDQAMEWLLKHDPLHLLVDIPSVDREEDAETLAQPSPLLGNPDRNTASARASFLTNHHRNDRCSRSGRGGFVRVGDPDPCVRTGCGPFKTSVVSALSFVARYITKPTEESL